MPAGPSAGALSGESLKRLRVFLAFLEILFSVLKIIDLINSIWKVNNPVL
jgi:hypothetical protein